MGPYGKRRRKKIASPKRIAFFTCARPGRSLGSTQRVPDDVVHKWVKTLPGPHRTIVSLLGHKPNGRSEFLFCTFHGKDDTPRKAHGKQPWQAWLDHHHYERGRDVERLRAEGCTIILIDSCGQTHTGTVCKHLRLAEDPRGAKTRNRYGPNHRTRIRLHCGTLQRATTTTHRRRARL
jgi:hypothetical protein